MGCSKRPRWVPKPVKASGTSHLQPAGDPETGNYQGEFRRARLAVYS